MNWNMFKDKNTINNFFTNNLILQNKFFLEKNIFSEKKNIFFNNLSTPSSIESVKENILESKDGKSIDNDDKPDNILGFFSKIKNSNIDFNKSLKLKNINWDNKIEDIINIFLSSWKTLMNLFLNKLKLNWKDGEKYIDSGFKDLI